MTHLAVDSSPRAAQLADPAVRAVGADDISAALAAGLRDFRAAPTFGLLLGAVYVLGGNLLLWAAAASDLMFLVYPLAAGFALIAPFAAVGLYEASRRIEQGEPVDVASLVGRLPGHARREIAHMALVSVFGLIVWVYAAGFVWALFFGPRPVALDDVVSMIVSTPRGVAFLMTGNLIGAVIATLIFSISVVSYPLLVDRDRDVVTAMITSIRVVVASPMVMLGWGVFVATMLLVAILPMFLGLLVVLPWLGHASWHLYRRAVVD
jgi:uncharacterized membrane protein